jgi:hypothetical protein
MIVCDTFVSASIIGAFSGDASTAMCAAGYASRNALNVGRAQTMSPIPSGRMQRIRSIVVAPAGHWVTPGAFYRAMTSGDTPADRHGRGLV